MGRKKCKKPNVVFIMADDLGEWAMGCSGNQEIHTPNLDRIAAEGMRFTHFFCASPVCSPARASLLTGRIPSQHGIHDWLRDGNAPGAAAIEYLQGQKGYTEVLAADGYRCGLAGKWHLGHSARPQQGHRDWYVHQEGGGPYYRAPMLRDGRPYTEPRYVTDAITEQALQFLDDYCARDAPFYLGIHYTAPHSPWDRDQHPESVWSRYEACPFDSVPEQPLHPWQIDSAPHGEGEVRRALLSGYYTAVTAMDIGIGKVLDQLERSDLRDDTLLIFTSDNGMNMGHHGIWGKGNGTFPQNMFDTSVKVPFLVRHPGIVPEGTVCDALVSGYDFMPTLLDYLGVNHQADDSLPGVSFAPLLAGRPADPDSCVVVHDEYGPVRMIRTRAWKYVHRYPYGPHELYDLAADPGERTNRIDDPQLEGVRASLTAQLEQWFVRHADPSLDGVRMPVTGKGQLTRAGTAGNGAKAFADLN
ncbi:sulfatase-like hydrolase/transferase [Paenibacillus sabuli]|uniref:sulfatase-like hydrolase/transferase n=1 Tax=Paenibacillus sabuli TaxID=2772509 RepID=UPI00295AD2C8|nr:sulfatase-like hydrolase/transferase [Paenibacillus sabuli]